MLNHCLRSSSPDWGGEGRAQVNQQPWLHAQALGPQRRLVLSVEAFALSDTFRGHHIWSTAAQLSSLSLI